MLSLERLESMNRHSLNWAFPLLTSGLLVGAILLLWGLVRLRRALDRPLLRFVGAHPIPVAGVDTTPLLRGLVRLLSGAVVLATGAVIAYWCLSFSLEQFPYTAPVGRRLAGYFLGVLSDVGTGILDSIPGLLMAGVIFYLARLVSRAQSSFLQGVIDGRIQICEYLCLTISFDHDIIDGAPAARFTTRLSELIASGFGLCEHDVSLEKQS